MNNSAGTAQAPPPVVTNYTRLTPEQQTRFQADLADREQQASSLAAAGMAADSGTGVGQILRAPPSLVGMPMPTGGASSSVPLSAFSDGQMAPMVAQPPIDNISGGAPQVESINWNLDSPAILGSGLDDIDMDFAGLFDNEEQLLDTGVP